MLGSFSDILNQIGINIPFDGRLPVDVAESDSSYLLRADVGGYRKDDISTRVDGDQICFNIKRKSNNDDDLPRGFSMIHRERTSSDFGRCLRLPSFVQPGGRATLVDGLLTVELQKAQPGANGTSIEIR